MTNIDQAIEACTRLLSTLQAIKEGRPDGRRSNPVNLEERKRRDDLARGRILRHLQSASFERATKSELTRWVVADAGRNAGERVLAELIAEGIVGRDGAWYVHGPNFPTFQE